MQLLAPGARVVATPCCATPETLLRALAERAASVPDMTLSSGLLLGSHPYIGAVAEGRLRFRTWHVTNDVRKLVSAGEAEYVPARASDVPTYLTGAVDVLLLRV